MIHRKISETVNLKIIIWFKFRWYTIYVKRGILTGCKVVGTFLFWRKAHEVSESIYLISLKKVLKLGRHTGPLFRALQVARTAEKKRLCPVKLPAYCVENTGMQHFLITIYAKMCFFMIRLPLNCLCFCKKPLTHNYAKNHNKLIVLMM